MNELLQKHGCSNVFTVPEGLKELMSDITREVLREQPVKIFDFIAGYLSALLITREHGVLAVTILDDLCDCQPSVSEHLMYLGMHRHEAQCLSQLIKEDIEACEPVTGKEKVREAEIVKKILNIYTLDEDMTAKVCQVIRNAYRDYWYRKQLLKKRLRAEPEEAWEIAARHTLETYKKTKPSFTELTRATQKIQAAYRCYHVRRNLLRHLKPKPNKQKPKVELPGPPLDIAGSREINLGPVMETKVCEDDIDDMLDEHTHEMLGLKYNPLKTITHVEDFQVMTMEMCQTPFSDRSTSRKSSLKSTSHLARFGDNSTPKYAAPRSGRMPEDLSNSPPVKMPSLLENELYVQPDTHKISFAQTPMEVLIKDHNDRRPEVLQDLLMPHLDQDATSEVPEDIADDLSDADCGDSVSEDITTHGTTDDEGEIEEE